MKIVPNVLKKGDTIGIITPSSPVENDDIEIINNSKKLLEDAGFKIEFSKNFFENKLGYSNTAEQKAKDINDMFISKEIKAIFCVSGGFNSNSTFEYLDYNIIKNNPKIICGFSDSTSILNIINEKTGLITFNGPTFKSLTSWNTDYGYRQVINRFVNKSLSLKEDDDKFEIIKSGIAQGELVGGNLSLTTNLVSGKYNIDFKNKILFLEELSEETVPAMVSNYLYTMKQNEVFNKINGIWLGNYNGEYSIEKILLDVIEDMNLNIPIIKSNNFGHIDKKMVIPIGAKVEVNTNSEEKIILIENCVKDV